ncbi:MAG: DUF362 domain-containing protein [archaeon]
MAKGAAIKFQSYEETTPKILKLLKLQDELKKYDKIILKPYLTNPKEDSTSSEFTEAVLKFCLENKNPVAEVFIAEGAEEDDTTELFESLGYQKLAEKYGLGLIDLNNTETEELQDDDFSRFEKIQFPEILRESFLISLPKLSENLETGINGSLSIMLGAFPSSHYSGFFSQGKNKIRKWPIKYSIHDILKCKFPDFAITDASEQGSILAGLPLEIDKQSAKLLGKNWQEVPYIKLLDQASEEGYIT